MMQLMLLSMGLGLKHSYDPDHLVAVGSFLRKSTSHSQSLKIGIVWAMGHIMTATMVTLLLFVFKGQLSLQMWSYVEKACAIMIILLGIWSLRDVVHWHKHRHGAMKHAHPHVGVRKHTHTHIFGIGVLQGLASNDELLLLMTATLGVTSLAGLFAGLGLFSIGVVGGMMLFALLWGYPLIQRKSEIISQSMTFITGTLGIGYGIVMLV